MINKFQTHTQNIWQTGTLDTDKIFIKTNMLRHNFAMSNHFYFVDSHLKVEREKFQHNQNILQSLYQKD